MSDGITIDNLRINVESNASAASGAIQGFVDDLEKLKVAVAHNTAAKKLGSLADSLRGFNDVSNPENKLAGIATELERMKNVGSVRSVANSLSSMVDTLAKLQAISDEQLTTAANAISRVAEAMRGFDGMKISGVSTTIKSLGDISTVTDKLSDETLTKFQEKVQRVSSILAPLNEKSTQLSTALKTIDSSAKKASTGMEQVTKTANNQMLTLASLTVVWNKVKSVYNKISNLVSKAVEDSVEWDGVSQRFLRGFGSNAQSAYSWIERLNQEMGLNKQQFMQYTSIYAQMLEGLGVVTGDAYQMALGYSELTYDIWAGYNDVFKTYDDAAQAIQSAISGNTRAIRRAGFSVLNTTLQQTAANHGLEISISGATEAEKSYLRYLALVDQAHATNIIGTYAQEMSTAEGVLRTLAQETRSLAQALGSLFIPMLQGAIPVLTAVVELASDAVHYIASLFGIQIQTIDWDASRYAAGVADYAEGVEDVADAYGAASGAAEKYKRTILGIDEINPLNAKNAGGGGGGGGGGSDIGNGITDWGIESVWTDSIFDMITSKVKDIKAQLEDWLPVIEMVGIGLGATLISAIGGSISQLNAFEGSLLALAVTAANLILNFNLTKVFLENPDDIIPLISEALTTVGAATAFGIAFGPTGAVISLGFSITAQLMGIYASVADGSTLDWKQTLLTLLEGTVAGGIVGFEVGGPVGLIVGAAIGLGLTASAVWFTNTQAEFAKAVQDDIDGRFGDIHYTAEQISMVAKQINFAFDSSIATVNGNEITMKEALQLYSDADIKLQNATFTLENAGESFAELFANIKIGVNITSDEMSAYFDDFLEAGQNYLNQHYLTTQIALGVLGMDDSDLSLSNELFNSTYGEWFGELGEQLHEVLSEAFVDGEWIPEKLDVAKDIFNEMQQVLDMVADFQFTATLQGLEMDLGNDFDAESFEAIINQALENAAGAIDTLVSARQQALVQAGIQLQMNLDSGMATEEANKIYEESVAEIARAFREKKASVTLGVLEFGVEQLNMRYSDEIASSGFDVTAILAEIVREQGINPDFVVAIQETGWAMQDVITNNLTPEVRASLNEMLASLVPEESVMKELAEEYKKAGESVPDAIREGINETERLKALTGDLNAINYMIGQALTQSDEFYTTMSTVQGAYTNLDQAVIDGITNNIELVYDAATGIPIGIMNAITGGTELLTPEMLNTLYELGINLGNGLGSSYNYVYDETTGLVTGIWLATDNTVHEITPRVSADAKTLGQEIIEGLGGPIRKGDETIPHLFEEIGNDSIDLLRQTVDSHSPSKAFESIGKDIMSGLSSPLESGSSSYNTLARTMTTLGSDMMTKLSDTFTESKLSSIGSSIIGGITGGMKNLDIPNFHIDWTQAYKEFTVLGKTMKMYIPWPNISFYAQGGFPNAGELFMARESGNEFVGRVGNKSAVANNDQIVEAIARGVADAMQQGNSLLQEQNGLLREMGRNTGGGGYITAGGIVNGLNQKNRRDGRSVVVLGV